MSIFLNTFGGSAISPTDVAFAEYSFSSNLTLFWPAFSAGQTDIAARFMNLTATVGSLNVNMPDATLVSVGYDVIIFNAGSHTFNVVDSDGGAIATIATGQTYYLLLKDNSTQAGTWQTVQFGVGTGSASAAALAGAGLLASAGLLNVNMDAVLQSSDYTIGSGNRAILQVWIGGAGAITLPSAGSVGDGFFFPLANNGSGSVTVSASGGEEIDGASSSVFTQTQSGFVVSSGSAWYTVGKGTQNNFAVTLLNLNVAGSSDVTETSAQAQNIIQQYTGVLTGSINVIVPNTVQLYYIFNNTSGSYALTVKTAAGSGIVIQQGTHVILYCDGTNIISAFTSNTSVLGSPFYALGTVGGTPNALTGTASNFVLQLGTFVSFSPASTNTGPATLNVQGTGLIDIVKLTADGFAPLAADDLFVGVPVIAYYDSTNWVALNIIYEGSYDAEAIDFTLSFGQFLNAINCTAALSITLPITTSLPPYFYCEIFANGGAVTLIPNAGDSIQGLSAGTHYVLPQGSSAKLSTDAAGKWVLFLLTTPYISNDTSTNATMYPVWVTANTGALPLKVSSTKLTFNPSTAALTTTTFVGALSGNATTATNAATATALQTARAINGVNFDGTAAITVTAAAGTLTGPTLNSGVTASSLTSVGTIATGTWNGTAIAVANGGTGATTAATARSNFSAAKSASNSDITSLTACTDIGTGGATVLTLHSNSNINCVNIASNAQIPLVCLGGVSTGQATTFDQFPATYATTGHYVLPNGYVRNWGISTSISAGASQTLNYDLTFPTAALGASLSVKGLPSVNAAASSPYYVLTSSSQITITNTDVDSGIIVTYEAWGH